MERDFLRTTWSRNFARLGCGAILVNSRICEAGRKRVNQQPCITDWSAINITLLFSYLFYNCSYVSNQRQCLWPSLEHARAPGTNLHFVLIIWRDTRTLWLVHGSLRPFGTSHVHLVHLLFGQETTEGQQPVGHWGRGQCDMGTCQGSWY